MGGRGEGGKRGLTEGCRAPVTCTPTACNTPRKSRPCPDCSPIASRSRTRLQKERKREQWTHEWEIRPKRGLGERLGFGGTAACGRRPACRAGSGRGTLRDQQGGCTFAWHSQMGSNGWSCGGGARAGLAQRPLWIQVEASTATRFPAYFLTWYGSTTSLTNLNRPWTPISGGGAAVTVAEFPGLVLLVPFL